MKMKIIKIIAGACVAIATSQAMDSYDYSLDYMTAGNDEGFYTELEQSLFESPVDRYQSIFEEDAGDSALLSNVPGTELVPILQSLQAPTEYIPLPADAPLTDDEANKITQEYNANNTQCPLCDYDAKEAQHIKNHLASKHNICFECEIPVRYPREDLKMHFQSFHSTKGFAANTRKSLCNICKKMISAIDKTRHLATHFTCVYCKSKFDNLELTLAHVRNHHPVEGKRILSAKYTKKQMQSSASQVSADEERYQNLFEGNEVGDAAASNADQAGIAPIVRSLELSVQGEAPLTAGQAEKIAEVYGLNKRACPFGEACTKRSTKEYKRTDIARKHVASVHNICLVCNPPVRYARDLVREHTLMFHSQTQLAKNYSKEKCFVCSKEIHPTFMGYHLTGHNVCAFCSDKTPAERTFKDSAETFAHIRERHAQQGASILERHRSVLAKRPAAVLPEDQLDNDQSSLQNVNTQGGLLPVSTFTTQQANAITAAYKSNKKKCPLCSHEAKKPQAIQNHAAYKHNVCLYCEVAEHHEREDLITHFGKLHPKTIFAKSNCK